MAKSGDLCRVKVVMLLDALAEAEAAGTAWLGKEEQRRLATLTAPLRRQQYLAGHWLVRRLAGGDPEDWVWSAKPGQTPVLDHQGTGLRLHASLSHSGPWVAAAIADAPLGLDLEAPGRPRDWSGLSRFVFSEEERARLDGKRDAALVSAFFEVWTLKEAWGKRSGAGLQPAQARLMAARPADAEDAEALSWVLPDQGRLALAAWPGIDLAVDGVSARPTRWRYTSVDLD